VNQLVSPMIIVMIVLMLMTPFPILLLPLGVQLAIITVLIVMILTRPLGVLAPLILVEHVVILVNWIVHAVLLPEGRWRKRDGRDQRGARNLIFQSDQRLLNLLRMQCNVFDAAYKAKLTE